MDPTQEFLMKAIDNLLQAQIAMDKSQTARADQSDHRHADSTTRLDVLEDQFVELRAQNNHLVGQLETLQERVDGLRDSAIRGEVASGRPSKDVARDFNLSPSRIAQIAPRRRYNNG